MNSHKPAENSPHTTSEVEKQAWTWLRLLLASERKAWDVEGFRRWVQADPLHRTVFNDVRRRWDEMKIVAGTALNDEIFALRELAPDPGHSRRRLFLGAAAAAAAAGLAVVYPPLRLWPAPSEWGADFRTATGEQRALALADHVDVVLNTQTSARRREEEGRTVGMDLITGEASIDLKEAAQSFVVRAGNGRCLASAGQFEVRYLDGKARVTCVRGTVRVEHPAGTRRLQARQQTAYNTESISDVAGIDPAGVVAWRDGELLFDRTRLADVIQEINRYRPGRVVLMNDAVQDNPVNGRFSIGKLDLALAQLQLVFNLKERSLPGGLLILS